MSVTSDTKQPEGSVLTVVATAPEETAAASSYSCVAGDGQPADSVGETGSLETPFRFAGGASVPLFSSAGILSPCEHCGSVGVSVGDIASGNLVSLSPQIPQNLVVLTA